MKWLPLLLLFWLCLNQNLAAQDVVPNIKVGFANAKQELVDVKRYSIEAGYYHCTDYAYWSYGPSASLMVISEDKKVYVGPKLSYEGSFLLLGAKTDLWMYNQNYFLSPSGGLSLFGACNFYYGYNFCFTDHTRAGSFFTINLNINLDYRPSFKIGG